MSAPTLTLPSVEEGAAGIRRTLALEARQLLAAAGAPGTTYQSCFLWPARPELRRERSPFSSVLVARHDPATEDRPADVRVSLDHDPFEGHFVTAPFAELTATGRALAQLGQMDGPPGPAWPAARAILAAADVEPLWQPHRVMAPGGRVRTLLLEGSARVPGPLGPGVIVIIGETSSGKTTLLEGAPEGARVPWGEPTVDAAGRYLFAHLERDISAQLSLGRTLVFVDSIKNLLLTGDNLGAGGLSQAFQAQLSTISAAARRIGVTLVFVLNILTMRSDVLEVVKKSLEGNVTAIIGLDRPGGEAPTAKAVSRTWATRGTIIVNNPRLRVADIDRPSDWGAL